MAYFLCYISKAFRTENYTKKEGLYTLDPIVLPSEPSFNINNYINTNFNLGEQLLMFSLGRNLAQMMLMNVSNLVVIRMQNVDYAHNRSIRKSMVDLVKMDRHRMFYKGLVP